MARLQKLILAAVCGFAAAFHTSPKAIGGLKNIVGVAQANGDFGTLLAAATAAGLVDTLTNEGPFTLFAPTNEAFAKLPAGYVESLLKPENKPILVALLKNHLVAGKVDAATAISLVPGMVDMLGGQKFPLAIDAENSLYINGVKVIAANIPASDGIIHIVESVLYQPLVPTPPSETPGPLIPEVKPALQNIVAIAQAAGVFSTLLAAASAAGLVDTLTNNGPYTLFAPTDDAFGLLPAGEVARLLLQENKDELIALLTHHIIPGVVDAAGAIAADGTKVTMLDGTQISIDVQDGKVVIDAGYIPPITVTTADILASNGIIHIVDRVISLLDPGFVGGVTKD